MPVQHNDLTVRLVI